MELIPLIYTTLKIAAILAAVTLIVSYISFRNKLKRGTVDLQSSEIKVTNEPSDDTPHVYPVENKNELLKPVIKKVAIKEGSKTKIKAKEEFISNNSVSKKERPKKTGHSKRVQIIKELQPVKDGRNESKEKLPLSQKTDKSLKSLDEDIISKYDKQDENDFHVLRVKDRKDKRSR